MTATQGTAAHRPDHPFGPEVILTAAPASTVAGDERAVRPNPLGGWRGGSPWVRHGQSLRCRVGAYRTPGRCMTSYLTPPGHEQRGRRQEPLGRSSRSRATHLQRHEAS